MKDIKINKEEYAKDLCKAKEIINENQVKAITYVNKEMFYTFYEVGSILNEKDWNDNVLEKIANELKEAFKYFTKENLMSIKQFAKEFTLDEIEKHKIYCITWTNFMKIMKSAKSHEEILNIIDKRINNQISKK